MLHRQDIRNAYAVGMLAQRIKIAADMLQRGKVEGTLVYLLETLETWEVEANAHADRLEV